MSYQKIIHLSDLHISTKSKPEVHKFNKLVLAISRYYPGTPVLITGDITDSATKPQMELAREYIKKLAETNLVLCVPGNHDYGALGNFHRWAAPEQWTKLLGTPFIPGVLFEYPWMTKKSNLNIEGLGVYEYNDCVFIGVDSGDPTNKVRMARGIITTKLAISLKDTLEKYKDKIRVVFLHHHPFTDDLFMELRGSNKLMAALKNNCEVLLFGHKHNIGAWWYHKDIPLTLACHKSTRGVSGNKILMGVIEIIGNKNKELKFEHSIKIV